MADGHEFELIWVCLLNVISQPHLSRPNQACSANFANKFTNNLQFIGKRCTIRGTKGSVARLLASYRFTSGLVDTTYGLSSQLVLLPIDASNHF